MYQDPDPYTMNADPQHSTPGSKDIQKWTCDQASVKEETKKWTRSEKGEWILRKIKRD